MNFAKKQNPILAFFLVFSLTLSGCVRYRPQPIDRSSFMERKQIQTQDNMTVTVAVLSDKESKQIFGVGLAKKGIQPVWVSIENQNDFPYFFILRNLDPNYYSTEEAAYVAHFRQTRQFLEAGLIAVFFFPALALIPFNFFAIRHANKKMDKVFNELALPSYVVMPKQKSSGFVFASVDEGTKHVKIDLIGNNQQTTFDFVVKVPGIKPDYTTKDIDGRYPGEMIVNHDEKELIRALGKFPCCTTNKKGDRYGDPFNLVVIGEFEDLVALFTAARWDETQALTFSSGWSMVKAFFTGDNDRYSPISPLYFDGHPQDIAFQKTRDNINQRLHFRLWHTPIRCNSKPVWIGAISRDIGVKFSTTTWYLTTHKIDPDLDDSRDYLLADMLQVEKIARYGFIDNKALMDSTHPKKNLTNDPYYTDNKFVVMELSTEDTQPKTFQWSNYLAQ